MKASRPGPGRSRPAGSGRRRCTSSAAAGRGEERHADASRGRDGGGDGPPPAIGLVGHGGVGGQRPPVVADDHGISRAARAPVQRVGVAGHGADLVVAVGGQRGGGVAPQEGGHGVVAGRRPARAAGSARYGQCRGSRGGTGPAARRPVPPRGRRTPPRWPSRCVASMVTQRIAPGRWVSWKGGCDVLWRPGVVPLFGGSLPAIWGEHLVPGDRYRGGRAPHPRPGHGAAGPG